MVHQLIARLAAPVAHSDPYIHLDGVLAYAAGVESIGYDGLDQLEDGGEPEYFMDEMPLNTYEFTGREGETDWVWAASAAGIALPDSQDEHSEPERWSTTRWRKRFDMDPDHQIKRTQVNESSGEFKSYNAALPYAGTDTLRFFFEGDADRVEELLDRHIAAIGKKRSQGFGHIRRFEITDVSDTIDSSITHNSRTLRSIPAEWGDRVIPGVAIERRTTKPPYWHAHNQCMAYAPFSDVPHDLFTGVDRGGART